MSGEEGLFDDDSDDSSEAPVKKRKAPPPETKTKKSRIEKASFIDDAAEQSGEEDDSDDEEDDEDENDYVRDGFVVDEGEEEHKHRDDLEDSDDEDDDDEDDDRKSKTRRVKKLKHVEQLDEDDLALIQEAHGEREREDEVREQARAVRAHNEAELRKGLFYDSEEEQVTAKKGPARVERYDEDGMDDFIDDDIGDQGDIIARGQREEEGGFRTGVSEAQLTEASEIFGTDYLEFMGGDEAEDDDDDEIMGRKYRERGVGVDLGVYSEEDELISEEDEDDDDLFGDDDDEEDESGQTARQRAEALKLKREKRELAKAERRKQARLKKLERRKARLRRAFEPVQLVENFCTDKDDEIRMRDAPERFYEWTTPFHGSMTEEVGDEEEEEAMWIMARIPDIATEFFSPPPSLSLTEDLSAALEKCQKSILDSIVHALRYMHGDKLEPAFISRYRADYVTSPAVRENLYAIMEEDGKWDQMVHAREKVEGMLSTITSDAKKEEQGDAEQENVSKLTQVLQAAQAKLDETLKQESGVKEQLTEFVDLDTNLEEEDDDDDDDDLFGKDDDDDDDDDLFGKDDDDEEENQVSLTAIGMNSVSFCFAQYIHFVFKGQEPEEDTEGESRIAFGHPSVFVARES
jgi:hypothetical protein